MAKINRRIWLLASLLCLLLLIPAFLGAFAEDEGTLPSGSLWYVMARLFDVLRFPIHTLFWPLVANSGGLVYAAALVLNCLLYGLAIERLLYLCRRIGTRA